MITRLSARGSRLLPNLPISRPSPSRLFSSLPTIRPSLQPLTRAVNRPSPLSRPLAPSTSPSGPCAALDLVPQGSISAHPAFAAGQIRCGPRNTMQRHTRLVQKRRHGFVSRKKSKLGRKILTRRLIKGRLKLGAH